MGNFYFNLDDATIQTVKGCVIPPVLTFSVTWLGRSILPINPLQTALFSLAGVLIFKISLVLQNKIQRAAINSYKEDVANRKEIAFSWAINTLLLTETVGVIAASVIAVKTGYLFEGVIGYLIGQSAAINSL